MPVDKIISNKDSIAYAIIDFIKAFKKADRDVYNDKAWFSHLGVGFSIGREYVNIWPNGNQLCFRIDRSSSGAYYYPLNPELERSGNYASAKQYKDIAAVVVGALKGNIVEFWDGKNSWCDGISFRTDIICPKSIKKYIDNYAKNDVSPFSEQGGKMLTAGSKIQKAILEKAKWSPDNYPAPEYSFNPDTFACHDPAFKNSPRFLIDQYRSMFSLGVTPEDFAHVYNTYRAEMMKKAA